MKHVERPSEGWLEIPADLISVVEDWGGQIEACPRVVRGEWQLGYYAALEFAEPARTLARMKIQEYKEDWLKGVQKALVLSIHDSISYEIPSAPPGIPEEDWFKACCNIDLSDIFRHTPSSFSIASSSLTEDDDDV